MPPLHAPTQFSSATAASTPEDAFAPRHHGQSEDDLQAMLQAVGAESLDQLIDRTVPADIRAQGTLELRGLDAALGESAALERLQGYAKLNRPDIKSLIGQGYHGTRTPAVILRNIVENPAWYTPYTPYQAEIAQGRMEAILNFQTVVSDLTGLPLAGASLLDEATAAAEAMGMCLAVTRGKKPSFYVANDVHPQTIAVVQTRAQTMGVAVVVGPVDGYAAQAADHCGVLVQTPSTHGRVYDPAELHALADVAHRAKALVVAATDLFACCLTPAPGSWGADIAVGCAQRFGVPMGYGGPHAGFLSTHEKHARRMPGRIIGLSRDARGEPALRMALQTREQHIRRDKATSNICTAQVLLAVVAGFYAVYHGPQGLRRIAETIHNRARALAASLTEAGHDVQHAVFFDTVSVQTDDPEAWVARALDAGFNVRNAGGGLVNVALDETVTDDELARLTAALTNSNDQPAAPEDPSPLPVRDTDYLSHPVFSAHPTEHALLRYATRLIDQDYSLIHGMIPLGSCTMKLNAASEMLPITWPGFADLHPFAPANQARGYHLLFDDLDAWLSEVTGFAKVSLQPNAGSQGEYAGLLAIRAWHHARGDTQRVHCLIPTSAHGTNPASAVIAGMTVVPVRCRDNGDIDQEHLREQARKHAETLSCLMVTYPSTHGVFEREIREICATIHEAGGQVYLDGANMNAQVGLTSPGAIGADVCHLNLHKTFCIPHGGGGPGVGPIGVAEHLVPHLPSTDLGRGDRVSAAPYGSPMVLPISWMYIAMMGADGLTEATRRAILNANYMAARLRGHYDILYTGPQGNVAHEFIVDCRPFDAAAGITIEDIAKRLIDYGFHAPTMSWPVAGTLMIEPTESEPKDELDRFCDAMIGIREEIRKIEEGVWPRDDNPLTHAPHPAASVTADAWDHAYPRSVAAYPADGQDSNGRKFWPAVARLDNPFGDRNLVCSCPPMVEA